MGATVDESNLLNIADIFSGDIDVGDLDENDQDETQETKAKRLPNEQTEPSEDYQQELDEEILNVSVL